MKVILNGALGKMGAEVSKLLEKTDSGATLAAGIDVAAVEGGNVYRALTDYSGDADVIMDFSHHACTSELTSYAVSRKLPLVVATTGQTEAELEMIKAAAKYIPVFLSANMSLGIAALADFARRAAALMPDADIEIVEKHHNQKLDAPSGTALLLADAIKESRGDVPVVCGRSGHAKREKGEIGISSLRLGGVVGEHEVILATEKETITLSHSAHDRALFAEGAIAAAKFIVGKPAGLYDMRSLVSGD
ncbi:MAG: 4-hydroxy-tetrahydrodipicolinate reductase [Clostridia bacterium]|nr:4-hydroxy-tetrahydrodipicolinate reductase [Clostridia bacterium]